MIRTLLQLLLVAGALLVSDLLTIQRVDACPDERLPALFGVPFAYRTSIPWVNSMSGVLYAKGLLLNWLSWAMVVAALRKGMLAFLPARTWNTPMTRVFLFALMIVSALVVLLFFIVIEWHLQWTPDFPFLCPTWHWSFMDFLK